MIRSTTVICVRHKGRVAIAGDGQVSQGQTILKQTANKIRRQLQALMVVADKESGYLISGTGDVVEPDDGILAIGSGGPFALAAARALIAHTDLGAKEIALEALKIAAGICVYTNDQVTVEEL